MGRSPVVRSDAQACTVEVPIFPSEGHSEPGNCELVSVSQLTLQFMYHETCYFSSDYDEEIRSLADPANMAAMTKVVQFPFTQPEVIEKTEEELAAQMERRKENGRRLQEMQAKQRAEKVCAAES